MAGLKLVVDGARVKGEFLIEFLTWFGEIAWSRKGADEEKISDPDYIDRKRSVVDQAWNDVLEIILPESDRREPRDSLLHMYIEQRVGRSDRYGNRPPKSTLDAPWGSITTVDRATVKHLVAVGADINYCPVSSKGQTILHWICEQFNYELPPYRPRHEVSVQYSNSDYDLSGRFSRLSTGSIPFIRFLIDECGANISARCDAGRTPAEMLQAKLRGPLHNRLDKTCSVLAAKGRPTRWPKHRYWGYPDVHLCSYADEDRKELVDLFVVLGGDLSSIPTQVHYTTTSDEW